MDPNAAVRRLLFNRKHIGKIFWMFAVLANRIAQS
jgi:hypothetical protein